MPWNGIPYSKDKPDEVMHTPHFGEGRGNVTYLILEDQRRVVVAKVMWLG